MSEMVTTTNNNNNSTSLANTFTDNPENKKLVFNATANADSLNEHMGEPITIKGAFLTRGVRKGYDNMPDVECVNTYIVDVNGKAYFSQASGVARDMSNLITLYNGDIEGLQIVIGEREIGGGRRVKFVELA